MLLWVPFQAGGAIPPVPLNMKLNFLASEPHYYDHIVPIWNALPAELRGTFYCDLPVLTLRPECKSFAKTARLVSGLTLVASFKDYQRVIGDAIYMEHGIGHTYSNQSPYYAGGKGKHKVKLFLNNHELTQARNMEAYPNAKHEIIGTPKLDSIHAKPITGRKVCVAFHWDCYIAPETNSALNHYKDVLGDLSQVCELHLHAHPRDNGRTKQIADQLGVTFIRDFETATNICDLYVNDNSSTMYEWLLTGRPVVVLNAPQYRKDIHHGLRFWEDVPGQQVDEPEDLIGIIERNLNCPDMTLAERERIKAKYYPFHPNATSIAVRVLVDYLS